MTIIIALDLAEYCVKLLEDDILFNAGEFGFMSDNFTCNEASVSIGVLRLFFVTPPSYYSISTSFLRPNSSGRGAVFTAYETIEMEASIMDGRTLEVSL